MIRVSISQLVEQAKLLSEDKRGNIVRLLGFSREAANVFHVINVKWSFSLARWMKEATISWAGKELIDATVVNFAPADAKRFYGIQLTGLERSRIGLTDRNVLPFFEDYPSEFRNIKNLSYDEVGDYVIQYERKEKIKDNTILKFDDGFFWYDTKSNECESWIAKKMQHCGTDASGHLQILFDDKLEPHVTMTWDKEVNTIIQFRGKQNMIPNEKYWPYIVEFVKEFEIKVSDYWSTVSPRERDPGPRLFHRMWKAARDQNLQENKRNIRLIIS